MAAQERCLFLWLLLLLVTINSEGSRSPQDVKFISQNFHNVLHWKPGNETENSTLFFVQHRQYGKRWSNKTECWRIRVTYCDLTQETNLHSEFFFARVRAFSLNRFSDWTQSETFCPMTDTFIGPPEIEVISLEKSILVKLTAPRTVLKKQNGSLSVKEAYFEVKYNIILSVKAQDQIGLEHQRTYITKNKTFEIQHLSPGTTYCISVGTKVSFNDNFGDLSKEQCVTLAEPNTRIVQSVIICLAGGTLVLVTLSIYLYIKYKYICVPRSHYPAVLTTWKKKVQEGVVFLPQVTEQTDIDKWEFADLSKHPCTSQLQNKCVTKASCKKYINIESSGNFQPRVFDPNSIPLDVMTFRNYLDIPQFTCSDYVQMMVEFDSLLFIDQKAENIEFHKISREHCQCQQCAQYEEQFQDQEGGILKAPTEFVSEYPEYINHDIWEKLDLNRSGLNNKQMNMA